MTKDSKPDAGAKGHRSVDEDADERRFNETLRKMLNTPPKPHKDKRESPLPKPRSEAGKKKA